MTMIAGAREKPKRHELASFLRSRRERVTPQEVGLPPGFRRRTPGLRREELAQLAGVGVTWYTWLEQGRPINASVQVLDAIARVLNLGAAERWHLYRLAEVPGVANSADSAQLPDDVLRVLDALNPNPACILNGRYDLLAYNETYAGFFFEMVSSTGDEHNALWQLFAGSNRGCLVRNEQSVAQLSQMVAVFRSNYARHVDEPEWTDFIEALGAASEEFAEIWATHPVSEPGGMVKQFIRDDVLVEARTTSFVVPGMQDSRMIVYVPASEVSAAMFAKARAQLPERRLRAAG
jgi:transcriptional regulator with XRE-family HTH domain